MRNIEIAIRKGCRLTKKIRAMPHGQQAVFVVTLHQYINMLQQIIDNCGFESGPLKVIDIEELEEHVPAGCADPSAAIRGAGSDRVHPACETAKTTSAKDRSPRKRQDGRKIIART